MTPKKCLTIAGFDGSGGAGIQADLKTFSALGCYGMTVLTAIPVQNTQGVKNCYDIPLACIREQLEAIFEDITPDSIKIGMLYSGEIIDLIADFLTKYAQGTSIVIDPVMIAKSGDPLLKSEAIEALKLQLFPLATVVTPNLPEAHALTYITEDMEELAGEVLMLKPQAVLLKGGHSAQASSDDFYISASGTRDWLHAPRIHSKNTHGTGCTLSSAISAYLAQGYDPLKSCKLAKKYVFQAIMASKDQSIGKGNGPVHHFHNLWPKINHPELATVH